MSSFALDVREVRLQFGGLVALQDASFTLADEPADTTARTGQAVVKPEWFGW